MQIKPHQIKHFAEQQRRFRRIRSSWNLEAEEEGSYFSRRFDKTPTHKEIFQKRYRIMEKHLKTLPFDSKQFYKCLSIVYELSSRLMRLNNANNLHHNGNTIRTRCNGVD